MFATWNRAMVGRSALRLTLALVLLAASLVTIGTLTAGAQVDESRTVTVTATINQRTVNIPGIGEVGQVCVEITEVVQQCQPISVDDQQVTVGPIDVSVSVTAAANADVVISGPTIEGTCVSLGVMLPVGASATVAVQASAQGTELLNVSQPISAERNPSASVSVCA